MELDRSRVLSAGRLEEMIEHFITVSFR
jgi:hypothetical protein